MSWCKNKCWVENPLELFCNFHVIPLNSMCLEEQMNAFTRFIFIVFLLMLIFMSNSRISFIFLFFSLLFIIILYYIQKRTMDNYQAEHFQNVVPSGRTSNVGCPPNKLPNSKRSPVCASCGNSGKCRKGCTIGFASHDFSASTTVRNGTKHIYRPQHTLFCDDSRPIGANDPNYVSSNQRLAGPANPKTFLKPVVVPPPADLDFWRANNLINHSHINTESQTDTYLSGYQVSNCCDNINTCIVPAKVNDMGIPDGTVIEGFEYIGISDPDRPAQDQCNPLPYGKHHIQAPTPTTQTTERCVQPQGDCLERYSAVRESKGNSGSYEGYSCNVGTDARDPLPQHLQHVPIKSPTPATVNPVIPTRGMSMENFEMPYEKSEGLHVRDNESGWVNTMCGYDPNQIAKSNLPSNLASGNCERSEAMKEYNKNLFTQNIQPDVYTRNEVIEPINANIGISFTQQFEPTTCSREDGNGLTYTEHDPRVYQPKMVPAEPDMSVTEADVYDPRFSGYGTSYRAYNDNNIGQTRFYYDDINSVRMPNYVVRSNIDFTNYADSYGPLHDNNKRGNQYNSNIRALAQDTFLTASLQQRNDLQERLMRKRNAELWQLRKYPMRTFGGQKGC